MPAGPGQPPPSDRSILRYGAYGHGDRIGSRPYRRISRDGRDWRLSPYVTVLPESELPAEYGLRADNESGRSRGAQNSRFWHRPLYSSHRGLTCRVRPNKHPVPRPLWRPASRLRHRALQRPNSAGLCFSTQFRVVPPVMTCVNSSTRAPRTLPRSDLAPRPAMIYKAPPSAMSR